MSTGRRPEANVDMDDFFDTPIHTKHKTTTFTMSTKSISSERNTAGDFQSPCPSGRIDRPRKGPGGDTDRGEILTLPSSQSDSEPETETHVKKKKNSPRSGRRSQRSAKSATSSSTRSKTVSGGSYSSTNTGSDTDTDSDSRDNGDGVDSGRRTPSPRKSELDMKHNTRERRTTVDRNAGNSHKQAWGADTEVTSQKTVERPKTAHHRRVNSQDGSNRVQSRNRESRDSSSGSRSYSSDSRSRSRSRDRRSRSRDNRSRSRSGSESSSCSSLTSTDSDASDVTDVSPLNSPAHKISTPDMRQWEQCQLGAKPPRSPANKGGYSQRSHPGSTLGSCRENLNLLQANSDTMDLKFLMQAVMEMEREKASSRETPVFFQPGGSKSTKQLSDSRQNFSFTNDKVRDIDTENQRLMRQILKYTAKKKVGPKSETSQVTEERVVVKKHQTMTSAVPHLTPSAINRMREQRRIERENQAMLKRLQKTRPTRTLQRDGLLDDYNKQLLAGLSIAAYHPPLKATRPKSRPGSTMASVYTNSATSLRSEFTPSTVGSRRPQSATLASRPAPDKRRRPHSATTRLSGASTRPLSGKSQGKVRPLSATVTRRVTRQRPIQPAWEPGW